LEGLERGNWPYEQVNAVDVPVIGVSIIGPTGSFPGKNELPARIDTGYDGFFLISEGLYNKLKLRLSEMPREVWATGKSVTGELFALRRASLIVQVPRAKLSLEGYGETFKGNQENLLGLRFLEVLRITLDGPNKMTHLL
jgi:predicted aspartyl protease